MVQNFRAGHDHEDWTGCFINEYERNIRDKGIVWELITKFIKHEYKNKEPGNNNIIADIVPSQLDADRLDYLLRDSHFCGVPYGNHNLEWIINNIAKTTNVVDSPRMGVRLKAVQAVEHFLTCRKLMTYSVYYHPKIVVFEYLVIEFLKELAKNCDNEKIMMSQNLRKFLKNYQKFVGSNDITKEKFVADNFHNYSQLKDNDVWEALGYFSTKDGEKISPKLSYISNVFSKRKLPYTYKVKVGSEGKAEHLIKELGTRFLDADNCKVLFIRRKFKAYKSDKDKIYVADTDKEFSAYSDIIRNLSDQNKEYCVIAWDRELNNDEIRKQCHGFLDIPTAF